MGSWSLLILRASCPPRPITAVHRNVALTSTAGLKSQLSERVSSLMPDKSMESPRTILDYLRERGPARAIALLGVGVTLAALAACGPRNNEAPVPTTASASAAPGVKETPSAAPSVAPSTTETAPVDDIEARKNKVSGAMSIPSADFKALPKSEQATRMLNYVDTMYLGESKISDDYANKLGDTIAEGNEILKLTSIAANWDDDPQTIEYKRRVLQAALEQAGDNNTYDFSEQISKNLGLFLVDYTITGINEPHFVFKGAAAAGVLRCTGVADNLVVEQKGTTNIPGTKGWLPERCSGEDLKWHWVATLTPTSDDRFVWSMIFQ
mgnify:FL=1